MPTELNPARFELPPIEGWIAGDSRQLNFTVTLPDGSNKDISNDEVRWYLLDKPYVSPSEATLSGDDSGVEIITDTLVDPTNGEFRVDVSESATSGEWGDYWQVVVVDPLDDSLQSWQGKVLLTDAGD